MYVSGFRGAVTSGRRHRESQAEARDSVTPNAKVPELRELVFPSPAT